MCWIKSKNANGKQNHSWKGEHCFYETKYRKALWLPGQGIVGWNQIEIFPPLRSCTAASLRFIQFTLAIHKLLNIDLHIFVARLKWGLKTKTRRNNNELEPQIKNSTTIPRSQLPNCSTNRYTGQKLFSSHQMLL